MKSQRIIKLVAVILGITLPFTLSTALHAQKAAKKVSLFALLVPNHAPIYVANAKGFFKDEGLEADIRFFTSGAEAVEGFLAGRANYVIAGQIPTTKLWTDPDIVGICPIENDINQNIIVARKEIKTPADLKGKRIGLRPGTGGDQLVRRVLKKAGISMKDVIIRPLNPTEGVAALDRGDIDAHAAWEPFGQQSLDISGDKVHILLNNEEYFYALMIISSTKKYVKEHPEETNALVKALYKATKFIKTNFDEAGEIMNKMMRGDIKLTKKWMQMVNFDVAMTTEIKASMEDAFKFNQEIGAIKQEKMDWNTMFDPSFLKAIDPKLVSANF